MRIKSTLLSILLLSGIVKGQTSLQLSSSEIKARLEKLGNTASVLYIAAHPDDENTRLLSYLVNERKVRTGYLSITRGDGGQNLIGTEQAEQLGLIRTQELLAARKIDGAEQFFTRANDFGFSKTSDETFKLWDKERILGDVVWVIRKFQPDIIITRFPGDERAGHGQHAASSILAQQAFVAAADAGRFPEQLKYVKPWKTRRIFWNTFNFGGLNTTSDNQLKVNVGVYNALLGKGYGEIASESRSQHKSQGFGVPAQRGDALEYFTLLNGEPASADLLEGVNTSWSRIGNSSKISAQMKKINQQYKLSAPQGSLPDLLDLYTLISQCENSVLKDTKLKEVADLILAVSGIWFEAYSAEPTYALGSQVKVKVQAISRHGAKPSLSIYNGSQLVSDQLLLPENQLVSVESTINADKLTQPYWLEEKHPIGEYIVKDLQNVGQPENPNPLALKFILHIAGHSIPYQRPIEYKFTDPIRGEVYRKLEIAPAVSAYLSSKQFLFTDNQPQSIQVKLKSFKNEAKGEVKLLLPEGWKSEPASIAFSLKNKGDEETFAFKIAPESLAIAQGKLKVEFNFDNLISSKSIQSIQYNHIPTITWFPEAEALLVKLDLKTAGKRIAYLPGAGDLVPDALKQVGFEVSVLNENLLINTDLSKFDAIVTGVRLYNIEPRMKFMNDKLLKYVENGGVLLVQYNVNQPLQINNIGPYPFTVSRERVTEEDAPIKVTNPSLKVFNYPNKISEKDFEGWIQERGIYYVANADTNYQLPLSMKDTGEREQNGALLIADYGKGRFVYTGLSFFRQLPAAVPGAYRLFVNLISK